MDISGRKLYRARGIFTRTGRESYLTNVWRMSSGEAVDDIKMSFPGMWHNVRVVEKDLYEHLNRKKKFNGIQMHVKHPWGRVG